MRLPDVATPNKDFQIQPVLRAPGSKFSAAPGLSDFVRSTARLMNMDFVWVRQRGIYIATVHDARGATSMDHHFEADPKVLSHENIWLEWFKQIADFLTEHGQDTSVIKTKLRDYADVYYSGEKINDNEPEQAGGAGSPDERSGHESGHGGDSGADRADVSGEGESNGSPPPIAPGWPETATGQRPRSPDADAHAG